MGAADGGAAGTAGKLAAAHARLRAAGEIQFDFIPLPPQKPPPEWLIWLGKLFTALGPVLRLLFWASLALAVAFILYFIARELMGLRGPRFKRRTKPAPPDLEWRPQPAKARALLSDADALAAQGLFVEAAHLLLIRSIADIDGRRPNLVKPALTSRDIAALRELPADARPAFTAIAQAVERSLFGGRPLDAEGFAHCRRAYEAFALPGAWA